MATYITAGVPQGTKLGLILLLIMVNDLQCISAKTGIWKYVDDVSISKTLTRPADSNLQHDLNTIHNWATSNWMKLNIKKCKEMRICFFRRQPSLPSLSIDNHHLDIVT